MEYEIIDKIGDIDITHPLSYSLVEQIYAKPTDKIIVKWDELDLGINFMRFELNVSESYNLNNIIFVNLFA